MTIANLFVNTQDWLKQLCTSLFCAARFHLDVTAIATRRHKRIWAFEKVRDSLQEREIINDSDVTTSV